MKSFVPNWETEHGILLNEDLYDLMNSNDHEAFGRALTAVLLRLSKVMQERGAEWIARMKPVVDAQEYEDVEEWPTDGAVVRAFMVTRCHLMCVQMLSSLLRTRRVMTSTEKTHFVA